MSSLLFEFEQVGQTLALFAWVKIAAVKTGLSRRFHTESCLTASDTSGRMPFAPTVWPFGNRRFVIRIWYQTYLQTHRSRIPHARYYQMEDLPIGSGPVAS